MKTTLSTIEKIKNIALIAHDNKKAEIIEWVKSHRDELMQHTLYATGTTGALIEQQAEVGIHKLLSGPMCGDQQVGARITEGAVDFLIFFWDPFEPMPHDPDVKALLRIAAVWNIPVACNRASADFLLSSVLMQESYERQVPDYERYMQDRVQS